MSLKKPKDILEEIQIIFEDIKENIGWESTKLTSDIKFEIGDAPEYYENFGVVRERNKIVFGNWINEIEPKTVGNYFWEFMIVRECFTFFLEEKILFGELSQLTSFILNFLALSYIQLKEPDGSHDTKFLPIQGRFLLPKENLDEMEKEIYSKIVSLSDVIRQGSSYKLLFNTYMNFISETPLEELDLEETLDDIRRYISNDPEEIAAPIYLKKNTMEVLLNLVKFGFKSSTSDLSRELNVNQSTITRQIAKLVSKFSANWRLEKNFFKLGLHTYVSIIRFTKDNKNNIDAVSEKLLTFDYIDRIFEGQNNDYYYIYTIFNCPHLVAERIAKSLENLKEKRLLNSFEIELTKNRFYRTAIINTKFRPIIENYKKLLNKEIPVKKISFWNIDFILNKEKENFERKDIPLLKLISFLLSKSISKYGLFGTHRQSKWNEFVRDNNIDPNNYSETINFLNKLLNQTIERELCNFRFNFSLSGTSGTDLLILKIKSKEENYNYAKIIDEISIFGLMPGLVTLDGVYFLVFGLNFNNKITELIVDFLKSNELICETFSVKSKVFRYIDYSELYDFDSRKWFL
ncbi:MAG: hypothetical protein GNW80_01095 [Asgard group archaeon]|nr:hypothetical protein [Asgard group archaeon]